MPGRDAILSAFAERFNRPCRVIARAPGRVNLIGEHTDYNDGFVLPVACEQSTYAACDLRRDGVAHVFSNSLAARHEWTLDCWNRNDAPHWTAYIAGVAALLRERGAEINGFDMLIMSDVPVGGGLSSSAALEVAVARALARAADHTIDDRELADLCRRAEHDYAGVPCGIMDQYISVFARADTALLLDCRSRQFEHVPLPFNDHAIVVIDSRVRHELADGEYERRQNQCRDAVRFFQTLDPKVRSLRDVTTAAVRSRAPQMASLAAARALHVTTENQRVLDSVDALRKADIAALGPLLAESHRSLRDDYQVSCPQLDELVEICADVPGVVGARMTGGGFGGCVVAIVSRAAIADLTARIEADYTGPDEKKAIVIATRAGRGASIELE